MSEQFSPELGGGHVRVESNCPSLEAGVLVGITLEYFERNALFLQALGEAEPTEACSDDQDVHRDAGFTILSGM